jgi:Protein of unknown function (DUF3987)/VirE N-terminal domain
MASSTIFKNFTVPVENKSLLLIGKDIISDKYKTEVTEIRQLIAQGNKAEADNKKKQLLAFTPSAVFTEKRQMPFLEMYSGFVHLDFDKLTPEQLQTAFAIICKIKYTALCFVSPSGNGLKVFVEINTGVEHHNIAYLQVQKYYEDATGLKADPSCKDITRLCFMSHDPNAYRTIENAKFIVALPQLAMAEPSQTPTAIAPALPIITEEPQDLNATFIFNQQINFTNQKLEYTNGQRNNYIYLLASNCNRAGLSEIDTNTLIHQSYDLPQGEIQAAVKSAYDKHPQEFAKFAKSANLQSSKPTNNIAIESELYDFLKNTPTIPDAIFETLPELLRQGVSAFEDRRKRDVFFTSALAIMSGCLPEVTGVYGQERVYPHLFTFTIAPPASGKGVMKNAKRLADKYHQNILEKSKGLQQRHEAELQEYKTNCTKLKKGETAPEKPIAPAFKIVFIPADCSHSRMIEHLMQNDGQGIICETEADTMSGAKKQDWGDYSPSLRKAFHHEKITFTRKTNNEYIEVNEPRIAVALTGTPNQAPGLISSAEDGLFSRFLFYAYKNEIIWQDPSPIGKSIVFNDHFEKLSIQVLDIINLLSNSATEVNLTAKQWKILNATFTTMLTDVTIYTSEDAASIVFRLGLVLYRVCMIFTALRKFENGDCTTSYTCTDVDFDNALAIVQTYLQHSILMFNNLPKQGDTMVFQGGGDKRKLFDALPNIAFQRKEAVEIAKQFDLSARTVDNFLKTSLGKTLESPKTGFYKKL